MVSLGVNLNEFPITTYPPWSIAELNQKQIGALKQMFIAYDIIHASNWSSNIAYNKALIYWTKKDYVTALHAFSQKWIRQNENSLNINDIYGKDCIL